MSPSLTLRRAVLLACAAGATEGLSNDSVVTVIHPHGHVAQDVLELAAAKYEAEHGVKVVPQMMAWNELSSTILDNHADDGKVTADVMTIGSTWASDLYMKNVLAPMGTLFEEWRVWRMRGGIERDMVWNLEYTYSFPKDRRDRSVPPEWHALPLDVGTRVLYYRKDLFKRWYNVERPPKTLKEALEIGKSIHDGERSEGRNVSGFAVPSNGKGTSDAMQVFLSFVIGGGSSLLGPGEICSFSDEDFQSVLAEYAGMYGEQHYFPSNDSMDIAEAFAMGEVAIMVGAQWLENRILGVWGKSVVSREQLGVAGIPSGDSGAPYTFQGGSAWAIPRQVPMEKQRTAFRFISWVTDPLNEFVLDLTIGSGLLPAYKNSLYQAENVPEDGVRLSALNLFDAATSPIETQPEWFSNPKGINTRRNDNLAPTAASASFPPSQLATNQTGDWVDYNMPDGMVLVVAFPAPTDVAMYQFVTGDFPGFAQDPRGWVVEWCPGELISAEYGINCSEPWIQAAQEENFDRIPLSRNDLSPMFRLTAPVTTVGLRISFAQVRGKICTSTCSRTIEQLPFAVPLNYPVQGFWKMGAVESDGIIDNMIQAVHGGEDVINVTARGCEMWEELMREAKEEDPPHADSLLYLMYIAIGVAVVALVLSGVLYLRSTRSRKEVLRLKSINEMAEDLAAAVAMMELESCSYLHELKHPNRIQSSFITIVALLKEYRSYLPAHLKEQFKDNADDSDEEEDEADVSIGHASAGTPCSDSAKVRGSEEKDTEHHSDSGSNLSASASTSPSLFNVGVNDGLGAISTRARRRQSIPLSLGSIGCRRGSAVPNPEAGGRVRTRLDQLQLRLKTCRVSVLVTNVTGWLKEARQTSSIDLIATYWDYLTKFTEVVNGACGVIDSLSGDRSVVTFNAMRGCSDHYQKSLMLPLRLTQDNVSEFLGGGRMTFGCSTGQCQAGNLGTDMMRKFTLIGSELGFASKLEEFARQHKLSCVMGDEFFDKVMGLYGYQVVAGVKLPKRRENGIIIVAELISAHATGGAEWMYDLNTAMMRDRGLSAFNTYASALCRGVAPDGPCPEPQRRNGPTDRIVAAAESDGWYAPYLLNVMAVAADRGDDDFQLAPARARDKSNVHGTPVTAPPSDTPSDITVLHRASNKFLGSLTVTLDEHGSTQSDLQDQV